MKRFNLKNKYTKKLYKISKNPSTLLKSLKHKLNSDDCVPILSTIMFNTANHF